MSGGLWRQKQPGLSIRTGTVTLVLKHGLMLTGILSQFALTKTAYTFSLSEASGFCFLHRPTNGQKQAVGRDHRRSNTAFHLVDMEVGLVK